MLAKRGIKGKVGESPTATGDDEMAKIAIHHRQVVAKVLYASYARGII